ncbi:MAG TPA: DUF6282 family protein [Bacillota bacterium]
MSPRLDLELLRGAIDLHVHSGPSLFHRHDTDVIVRNARDLGLRALVLKHHHIVTTDRARAAMDKVPGIDVFGSITLNFANGGINPFAVDYALRLGARKVWMPTIDTAQQERYYGALGGYGSQQSFAVPSFYRNARGICILGEDGRVIPSVREVLALIAEHDAILGVGHLTPEEIAALVREARAAGVHKVVVDHPHLPFLNLSLAQQRELVEAGAVMNYAFSEITPKWFCIPVPQLVEHIHALGPEHIVLSTDLGQLHNPLPAEGLRIYVQLLLEAGVPAGDIRRMLHDNPARLLYGEA